MQEWQVTRLEEAIRRVTRITWVGVVSRVPHGWRVVVVTHDHIHDEQYDERDRTSSGEDTGATPLAVGLCNKSTFQDNLAPVDTAHNAASAAH